MIDNYVLHRKLDGFAAILVMALNRRTLNITAVVSYIAQYPTFYTKDTKFLKADTIQKSNLSGYYVYLFFTTYLQSFPHCLINVTIFGGGSY